MKKMESKQQLLKMIEGAECRRREYLKDFFNNIPNDIVKEIVYEEIPQNKYILQAGSQANTVFFILQGHVIGLDHQKEGHVYSFMDFTKMYIVGDFELFSESAEYSVSIRAAEKCRVLKISSKTYLNWIRHDENALFLRLNKILTALTFERKFDREYMYMDCKERLEYYLINFYEKEKKNVSGIVRFSKTQAELAEKVGFNKRSVQRAIVLLEKEGLITTESGKITISYEQYLRLRDSNGKEE